MEPISLSEAKLHLRITSTDDDTAITDDITAARKIVESILGSQLITATLALYLKDFPCSDIKLPYSPVQSVSSITYFDTNGSSQTLSTANYQVDTNDLPAKIKPAPTYVWPNVQTDRFNAITITYIAGFGSSGSNVPAHIRQAIKIGVADLYEERQTGIVGTIRTETSTLHDLLVHDIIPMGD